VRGGVGLIFEVLLFWRTRKASSRLWDRPGRQEKRGRRMSVTRLLATAVKDAAKLGCLLVLRISSILSIRGQRI
jgi:hypothetical protein